MFRNCDALEEVFIPSSVTSIGSSAFYECPKLREITIPANVTSLGSSAFRYCSSLEKVYFKGPPPSTGDNYVFSGVKSGAEGYYTADNETAWKAVIDSNGYWKGLKMRPSYYKFIYDSNNGSGETVTRIVEKGTDYVIEDIQFSLDGYSFMGWTVYAGEVQTSAFVVTGDECNNNNEYDEIRCCANYCKLEPHSANWQEGSLTLEGAGFNGYDVNNLTVYCSSNDTNWVSLDRNEDEVTLKIEGDKLTMTDKKFASRLGGIEPIMYKVRYQINDNTACEVKSRLTRNRHGIFIGVGEFSYEGCERLPSVREQTMTFKNLAESKGGFKSPEILINEDATHAKVAEAFESVSKKSKDHPGDICLIYFSTHGGTYKPKEDATGNTIVGYLCLHDKNANTIKDEPYHYHEGTLAKHILSLGPQNGVGVVCIISACYSGSFFIDDDHEKQYCEPDGSWCHKDDLGNNVAWITGADATHSVMGDFDKFLISYGFGAGWAWRYAQDKKQSGDGTTAGSAITFYDLAVYAIHQYQPIARLHKQESGGMKKNDKVLKNIVLGETPEKPDHIDPPSAFQNVEACSYTNGTETKYVKITWSNDIAKETKLGVRVFDSDYNYVIMSLDSMLHHSAGKYEYALIQPPASYAHKLNFAVIAVNGLGVEVSDFVEGWRDVRLVVFNVNGGKFKSDDVNNFQLNKIKDYYVTEWDNVKMSLLLPEPIMEGCEFKGWYTDESLQNVYNGLSMNANGDLELFAKWEQLPKYNITFNLLDTTSGESLVSLKYPDIVSNTPLDEFFKKTAIIYIDKLLLTSPQVRGYVATEIKSEYGGSVAARYEGAWYVYDLFLGSLDSDKTYIVELWQLPPAVNANNSHSQSGTYSTTTYSLANGETMADTLQAMNASVQGTGVDGQIFAGWYSEEDGKGERLTANTVIDTEVDFYAHWLDTSFLMSNTCSSCEVWTGTSINECNFDFMIPASRDLPKGSIVRVKKITFASLNESFVVWDTETNKSDPYYIKLNGIESDYVNGGSASLSTDNKIQSNAGTSDCALTYAFSENCYIEVGHMYPAVEGNDTGMVGNGIALLWSNKKLVYGSQMDRSSVRYVRTNDPDSVMSTATADAITGATGYCPVYEMEVEIVSIAERIAPEVADDNGAKIVQDGNGGYVVIPSDGQDEIVVSIPEAVNPDDVTIRVTSETSFVKRNGARLEVMVNKDGQSYNIAEYLDLHEINGYASPSLAQVKEAVVKEVLDSEKGAEVDISDPESPELTTSETKPGLTYTLLEGVTLEEMMSCTTGDSKVGDGEKWTPNITVKGGTSGFYTIKVEK